MKRFANLYDALDATSSTLAKLRALETYFSSAPAEDAAWAIFFLRGGRLKRLVPSALLHQWTLEIAGLSEWLLGECYSAAGDYAETVALLLEGAGWLKGGSDEPLALWAQRLQSLSGLPPAAQGEAVKGFWSALSRREVYLLLKLLTGELRVGVSDPLVVRALSQLAKLPPPVIAHRLMGNWEPSEKSYRELLLPEGAQVQASRPYPFFLASPLERGPEQLGDVAQWLIEWKWDGIRGQLVRREGQVFLWSRGEELITDRFPEIKEAAMALPNGTVLDGEVLAFSGEAPLRFSVLQRRIGRRKLTPPILQSAPVAFMAFDLLEDEAKDIRHLPLRERRERLQTRLSHAPPEFRLSPEVRCQTFEELEPLRGSARQRNVEGLLLKRRDSAYGTGRKRGDWWKWKIDPYSMDAVLVYAQPGSGRRATLLTDYTFAVWDKGELLPIAKAYSGLSDAEIAEVDKWIRQHTLQRYGPVRSVEPVQVFELHFEALAPSPRHKSGVAVRFPRIARWRTDKKAQDADTLEQIKALLNVDSSLP